MSELIQDADEWIAERAAIREYDAGESRDSAEQNAAVDFEQYRHACEVRWCCANPSRVNGYVADVRQKRGNEAADKLLADAREQYRRGNRGEAGKWL